jgi:plasmid stabilization system protein ParE
MSRNHNFNAAADDIHDIWHHHWKHGQSTRERHTHPDWGDDIESLAEHLLRFTPAGPSTSPRPQER